MTSPDNSAEARAREVLDNGTWADVIAFLRTIKTEDEIVTELCASPNTVSKWAAGTKMRPTTERLMRDAVRQWLGLPAKGRSLLTAANDPCLPDRETIARIVYAGMQNLLNDDGTTSGNDHIDAAMSGDPHALAYDQPNDARRVADAILRASLTFSAEQNTGAMPGRALEEGVKQFRKDTTDEDGFWRTCSGCYECEDGYPNGDYPHNDALGCTLGGGCGDCGGIGAIWDMTDYERLAADMLADDRADAILAATGGTGAGEGWRDIASAPKDGTPVLLWGYSEDEEEDAEDEGRDPERKPLTGYVGVQKHIWWSTAGGMRQVNDPTHWMPLPTTPTGDADRG